MMTMPFCKRMIFWIGLVLIIGNVNELTACPCHAPVKKQCWVTLLTNDQYSIGVETLAKSLHLVNSAYPLVILMGPNVTKFTESHLASLPYNVDARPIEILKPKVGSNTNYIADHFGDCFTKFHCWSPEIMAPYEKVAYVDADMLVLQNMDEVFDLLPNDAPIAWCPDCICNSRQLPNVPAIRKPENCGFTYQDKPRPAGLPTYFNAGFFVTNTDHAVYDNMMQFLDDSDKIDMSEYKYAEQDWLNEHYPNGIELPYIYNTLKSMTKSHPKMFNSSVKNIHFVGEKPWNILPEEDETVWKEANALWWKVYRA